MLNKLPPPVQASLRFPASQPSTLLAAVRLLNLSTEESLGTGFIHNQNGPSLTDINRCSWRTSTKPAGPQPRHPGTAAGPAAGAARATRLLPATAPSELWHEHDWQQDPLEREHFASQLAFYTPCPKAVPLFCRRTEEIASVSMLTIRTRVRLQTNPAETYRDK